MSQMTADPYAVLGVERDASQQQVARAYRRLAKRYHPDVRRDDQSTEQMRRLNQAWESLSSPVRRARYDADHPRFGSPARGHWSAPRRTAPVAASPETWPGSWASPPPAGRAYARRSTPADDAGPPRWPGVLFTVVLGLIALAALFAGILPFPLVGFAVLILARGVFDRFDERRG